MYELLLSISLVLTNQSWLIRFKVSELEVLAIMPGLDLSCIHATFRLSGEIASWKKLLGIFLRVAGTLSFTSSVEGKVFHSSPAVTTLSLEMYVKAVVMLVALSAEVDIYL